MTTATAPVPVDGDPIPVDPIASLPRDLAVIKMENDTIMAAAAAHPRDYKKILADIKSQLAAFKSFAQEAVYSKPVGKDKGKMKHARGLSIRAAEAIAEAYGYCKVRCDITKIDDNTLRVEATFVDFQRGRVWQDCGLVSRAWKDRNGRTQLHSDDRFYNVVAKADGSKRIREVILRCVPAGLKSELMLAIDEQLDSFLDDSTTQKLVASFSGKNVSQEQLEEYIGKRVENFDANDRKTLLGIFNAIEQGEALAHEIFPTAAAPEEETGAKTSKLKDKLKGEKK